MKRLLTATLAIALLAAGTLVADAKLKQDADKKQAKPHIALTVEGKVTKEIHPTAVKEMPGVGTDYTFEWSGGKGDIIITE